MKHARKLLFAIIPLLTMALAPAAQASGEVPSSVAISSYGAIATRSFLFYSGFEAGDLSDAEAGPGTYGGHVEIATSPVHSGLYSARCWAEAGGARARIYPKGYGTGGGLLTAVYIRAYVWFDRLDTYVQFLRTAGHYTRPSDGYREYTYFLRTVLRLSEIELQLGMNKGLDSDWKAYDQYGNEVWSVVVPYTFSLGRWYCVEMRAVKDSVNGGGQIWVDGELMIDAMELNTSAARDIDTICTGIVLCGAPLDLYVDDFAIDTEYIGP